MFNILHPSSLWMLTLAFLLIFADNVRSMSEHERISFREEAREMFIHAYDSYMQKAYPADELMPLSCRGRYRGVEPNRGDVDEAMGNFSLTLIDTLDTLVILGNFSEFERAVKLVIQDVSFDSDIVVSVFETNIRVVGGLLSAHVLAQQIKETRPKYMQWYDGQLLLMAKDIGYRLLPAFNSSTGIPHPRVNLRHGLNSARLGYFKETCTACAGTMVLEFAALSRLTGEPIFEIKARRAMDYLWQNRHRQSNLVGNVINIHTGDWIRKESGVGAGIDSYYEYCLKAYILLGDETYLHRFNRHYAGVMKYVSQGPLLIDVHMHRPQNQAKNFMDSLLAFWPGLQILKGDIKPAIETHEVLYQIMQRYTFLPEAFMVDSFNVHWPHHPLRPEFIESTYFLYQATRDSHYLQVGKEVLSNLQNFTRTECGFAAVNDVRTRKKEDRMDSFFLAETLKYLFILFSKKDEIGIDLENYIFTTEGHLLPLYLADISNGTTNQTIKSRTHRSIPFTMDHHCPREKSFWVQNTETSPESDAKNLKYYRKIRQNVSNFVSRAKPEHRFVRNSKTGSKSSELKATEFRASNEEHIKRLSEMGISVIILNDGRYQLIQDQALAKTDENAKYGVEFMKDMMKITQNQIREENQKLRTVSFTLSASENVNIKLYGGPAQFGLDLTGASEPTEAEAISLGAFTACKIEIIRELFDLKGKIAVVKRGQCMFVEKARNVEALGGVGVIISDTEEGSSAKNLPMFAMSGDGNDDVTIPAVFLYNEDAKILTNAIDEFHNKAPIRVKLEAPSSEELHEIEMSTLKSSLENINIPEKKEDNQFSLQLGTVLELLKSESMDLFSSLKDIKNQQFVSYILEKLHLAEKNMPKGPEEDDLGHFSLGKGELVQFNLEPVYFTDSEYQMLDNSVWCVNPLSSNRAFQTLLISSLTLCF